MNEEAIEFKRMILESAKLKEESFDEELAKEKSLEVLVDYEKCYRKNLRQACEEVSKEMSEPIYLLLTHCWNDIIDWCEETK